MNDKREHHHVAVQVVKKKGKSRESQTQMSAFERESVATQCGEENGSYQRTKSKANGPWTYDRLKDDVLVNKSRVICWLIERKLICSSRLCPQCDSQMRLVECSDRSDGCKWECRRQVNGKRHKVECSIRKGSWFEGSNLTLEEILKLTCWWCRDVQQETMRFEVDVSGNTVVDWDSFCREVCEVNYLECEEKIAVDDRSEAILLPIIETFIKKGTTIISDCWKAYCNLEKHGYKHETVNHSKEFVNKNGDHTNKIEGHWRQAKAKFPPFGIRKYAFSSYLAEFLWRYEHKEENLFEVFLEDAKKIYEKF